MLHALWNWFLTFTGSNNTSGVQYGFWSGFGSDIGELAIIGGLISIFRKHNCHVKGCWRIGKYPVEDTPYSTCRRHHPAGIPELTTAVDIKAAHRRGKNRG